MLGLILILGILFIVPAANAEPPDQALRRRVVTVLKAFEYRPSPKLWKRWGNSKVNDVLAELALDTRVAPSIRRRATMSLAQLPSTRTRSTLGSLISDKKTPMGIRRQALYSYAYAYPRKSISDIEHHLVSGPEHLREAAAHAMALVRDIRVDTLLNVRLASEASITVLAAIERTRKIRRRRASKDRVNHFGPSLPGLTPANRDKL
jgi:uncharacterized protein (UPF0147 family)